MFANSYVMYIKVDQLNKPWVLNELKAMLKSDFMIYEKAKAFYEEQWKRPLYSCNNV